MHEIHVTVVSPEEAADGTAEFWSGGRLIGYTRLRQRRPHLLTINGKART